VRYAGSLMDGFVDQDLARRFESFEARTAADLTALRAREHPGSGAETLECAGATCAWFAPESVLSHVFGYGLSGPTRPDDLDAIEEFYRSKGDHRVQVELSPFARRDALALLRDRAYGITGFEQLLVLALDQAPPPRQPLPGVVVRKVEADERKLWVRVAGEGFFAPDGVPLALAGVFELSHRMPGTTALLAWVGDEPAAAAAVCVQEDIAGFFGAATLQRFRGAGAHSALLDARVALALEAGARWATAGALPGSQSQHNMERRGFRVAYTRPVMVRAL